MSAQVLIARFDEVWRTPVIGDRDDVVAGLVLVTLGEFLEDVALGVGQQMIGIAKGVGIIGDADRR